MIDETPITTGQRVEQEPPQMHEEGATQIQSCLLDDHVETAISGGRLTICEVNDWRRRHRDRTRFQVPLTTKRLQNSAKK